MAFSNIIQRENMMPSVMIQAKTCAFGNDPRREHSVLDQGVGSRGRREWSGSGYLWKTEQARFGNRLAVGYGRKTGKGSLPSL